MILKVLNRLIGEHTQGWTNSSILKILDKINNGRMEDLLILNFRELNELLDINRFLFKKNY